MKKMSITTACIVLLLSVCSEPVHADFEYYNNATITKDADDNGNVTYTNKANGKTYTIKSDGTRSGDDTYNIKSKDALKKDTVELGHYRVMKISLPYGQSNISKLKIKSGKGVITAKISKEAVVKGQYLYFEKDKDGSYYYRDRLTGQKINMGTTKGMYVDYADYKIRIFGKKLGKAVLEYQINDSSGNKITNNKIAISVKKNGSAITSATFGGKSLLLDYSKNGNNKNYIYNNGTKSGSEFTSKKSGKFKVRLSNDYILKNIYVERIHGRKKDQMSEDRYDGWETEPVSMGLDLNGDGDYNDVIDGFVESKSTTVYYEKIRNGQKLVLNSDPYIEQNDYLDKQDNSRNTLVERENLRDTRIIVVYQDKRTGSFYWWETTICRLVKKV